jgi:hypothetical protein
MIESINVEFAENIGKEIINNKNNRLDKKSPKAAENTKGIEQGKKINTPDYCGSDGY